MKKIFTIGTQDIKGSGEKRDLNFLKLLKIHEIDIIIDIRLSPEPRRATFASGRHLESLLQNSGVEYIHAPVFAPEKHMIHDWRKHQDWELYESDYKRLWEERNMLQAWQTVAGRFTTACVLCAEQRGDYCHRNLLGAYLVDAISNTELIALPRTDKQTLEATLREYVEGAEDKGENRLRIMLDDDLLVYSPNYLDGFLRQLLSVLRPDIFRIAKETYESEEEMKKMVYSFLLSKLLKVTRALPSEDKKRLAEYLQLQQGNLGDVEIDAAINSEIQKSQEEQVNKPFMELLGDIVAGHHGSQNAEMINALCEERDEQLAKTDNIPQEAREDFHLCFHLNRFILSNLRQV